MSATRTAMSFIVILKVNYESEIDIGNGRSEAS